MNIFVWLCEMNLCNTWSEEHSSKHRKFGEVHQGRYDLQQTLHVALYMLRFAGSPLEASLYFIRPTFSLQTTKQIVYMPLYMQKKGILCYILQPEKYTL